MRLPLPLTIFFTLLSCGAAAGNPETVKSPAHTNRLASEKSPYLLQHRHNPVDWYPWGPEAFARAKAENKPILLSIGYSTCHWCHVMERESFENEAIGKYLNEHFISIKLDREERPDIDQVYMTAMQAIGLGGGWPLNVFLTPDRKPFYGGTYFPPEDKDGRPGFPAILRRVAEVWKTNKEGILGDAEKITTELKAAIAGEEKGKVAGGPVDPDLIVKAAIGFSNNFDEKNGGFSGAPKFPQPKIPSLVLLTGVHTENKIMVDEVLFTCRRMAAGGLYDQIGGGFARYSVDDLWLVPHFEKMLYDNAQLIDLYLDAGLVSGDQRYHAVARDIIKYVLRDMTHPEGGFYSAEDADSEGQEGKFYCFTKKELLETLTPEEATFAIQWFGVTEEGNFEDHSHPQPLPNLNVLHVADPERTLSPTETALLASVRSKLYDLRKTRVRPHLDDKVLSSWNGLMLGPLARAAVILNEPAWMEAAKRNYKFVTTHLWDAPTRTLHHRWRDGERDSVQLLNAYAFYLNGSIMLYQATFDPEILTFCMQLADSMIDRFYDAKAGGFYTSEAGDDLLFRARDSQDGAEPAGNSMAVQSLLQLAAITGNPSYRAKADATLSFFGVRLTDLPEAFPMMLHNVAFASTEPYRAVITGDPALPATKDLIRAAHSVYQAHRVVLGSTGPVEEFARTLTGKEGKPTAYICSGTSCQPPTHDPLKVTFSLRPPGLAVPEPAD